MMKGAFLGLGAMGRPMAGRLVDAGHDLTCWNRTPRNVDGLTVVSTIAEAVADAEATIVMVTDDAALSAVTGEALPSMPPGALLINMSTVSGEATEILRKQANACDLSFVDAPVSGTTGPAAKGALVILAGGEEADIDRAQPLFDAMGKETIRCGPVGAGTAMKQGVNLLLAGMMAAFAEAKTLVEAEGISFDLFRQAVAGGAMAAPMFTVKGEAIANENFAKTFPVHLVHKDLFLALDTAAKDRLRLPQTIATKAIFDAAMEAGLADEDLAAIVKVVGNDRD